MVNRTTFVEVADGDSLSQGYFNEIGVFRTEKTDASGPYTHNANSWSKEQTFTFPNFETNWEIIGIEFDDINLSDSSADSADYGLLGVIITDGSTHYNIRSPAQIGTDTQYPAFIDRVAANTPDSFVYTDSSLVLDNIVIPLPANTLTGATSWAVEIYLNATQTASNTVTLAASFTVRLIVRKRAPRDLGITPTQA